MRNGGKTDKKVKYYVISDKKSATELNLYPWHFTIPILLYPRFGNFQIFLSVFKDTILCHTSLKRNIHASHSVIKLNQELH